MAILTASLPVHNFDQQNQIPFSISTLTNAYPNVQQVTMEERTQKYQETYNSTSHIKLPVGMRFNPTDQQIISYFLARKINGWPILPPASIPECDIYGEKEPWKIFDKDMDETFYFFTKLKRRSKTRIHRRAGCGTWQNQNRSGVLDAHQSQTIGYDTMFSFKPDKQFEDVAKANGRWIMHEFSVEGHDYVLCKIRNRDHEENFSNFDAQQTSATNKSRKRVRADDISQRKIPRLTGAESCKEADEISHRKMAGLCETRETELVSASTMDSGLNSDQSTPSMYFDFDNNSELDLFNDHIAATFSTLDKILCYDDFDYEFESLEWTMPPRSNIVTEETVVAPELLMESENRQQQITVNCNNGETEFFPATNDIVVRQVAEGNVSDHEGMELGAHADQNSPSMKEMNAAPQSMIYNGTVGVEQSDVPHTAVESNYSFQEKDDLGFDGLEDINLMEEIPSLSDYDVGVDTVELDDFFNFELF